VLNKQHLENNFANVTTLGNGVLKCEDETPKSTYFYYLKPATAGSNEGDLLAVSENNADDDFAQLILNHVSDRSLPKSLKMLACPTNKYSFSALLLAPKDYHAYFKGILDVERDHLILCLPVHRSEFVGDESIQEFSLMRKQVVPTLDWMRPVHPKIILRFDNPKTHGGTGNMEILAKYQLVLREIDNLDGIATGFLEISNFNGHVIEILSPEVGIFTLIRERNDQRRENLGKEALLQKLWIFLVDDSDA
jgi:hypothetical protein